MHHLNDDKFVTQVASVRTLMSTVTLHGGHEEKEGKGESAEEKVSHTTTASVNIFIFHKIFSGWSVQPAARLAGAGDWAAAGRAHRRHGVKRPAAGGTQRDPELLQPQARRAHTLPGGG